jgi:hypothetical protein
VNKINIYISKATYNQLRKTFKQLKKFTEKNTVTKFKKIFQKFLFCKTLKIVEDLVDCPTSYRRIDTVLTVTYLASQ